MTTILTGGEPATLLPAELRLHPLFEGSACYAPLSSPLAVEKCDRTLRRLRHMPSSSDETPKSILDEMNRIYAWGRTWMVKGESKVQGKEGELVQAVLQRMERLRQMVGTGVSSHLRDRVLAGLSDLIPVSLRGYIPSSDDVPSDMLRRLGLLEVLLLDNVLASSRHFGRRYLKKVYRAVDRGLTFNSTTDLTRLKPVLAWMARLMTEQGRRGCSYVDVGCAMAGGAPGVRLAAEMLRAGGLCEDLHGVDVIPPDRLMARQVAREERILLYGSDLLRRPLPRRYDVILLANVHRHLTEPEQMLLLTHLFQSMENEGMLFVNWRFNDRSSPCLCLRREGEILTLVSEENCI